MPRFVIHHSISDMLLIYISQMFVDASNKTYRNSNFDMISGEEGDPTTDRPLIVQFCANDPEQLLISAKVVESHCEAVDLNLGCPQDIAKRGHYGSFLQDDWELIYKLSESYRFQLPSFFLIFFFLSVNTLHVNLSVPVTAKFRVFPTVEKTVEYARMLERAGAQIITCHGRIREQRGQNTVRYFPHLFASGPHRSSGFCRLLRV